jgi:hypothetical protein
VNLSWQGAPPGRRCRGGRRRPATPRAPFHSRSCGAGSSRQLQPQPLRGCRARPLCAPSSSRTGEAGSSRQPQPLRGYRRRPPRAPSSPRAGGAGSPRHPKPPRNCRRRHPRGARPRRFRRRRCGWVVERAMGAGPHRGASRRRPRRGVGGGGGGHGSFLGPEGAAEKWRVPSLWNLNRSAAFQRRSGCAVMAA